MTKLSYIFLIIAALGAGTLGFWYYQSISRVPDTTPGGEGIDFFPFGDEPSPTTGSATDSSATTTTDVDVGTGEGVSTRPVAGFTIYEGKEFGATVRYVERETGHIYDVPLLTKTKKRISNTTIPKVREVVWVDKDHPIYRYLGQNDEIISFLGEVRVATTSEEGKLTGSFLDDNITELLPTRTGLFYISRDVEGAAGYTAGKKGEKVTKVFSSPIIEWTPLIVLNGTYLYTRPGGLTNGYLYRLESGNLRRVLGDIPGLTVLFNPAGTTGLLSRSNLNTFTLSSFTTTKGQETTLNVSTLPEKCLFVTPPAKGEKEYVLCSVPKNVPQAVYPDAWYQGQVSFDDILYKINLETGELTELSDLAVAFDQPVDATELSISADKKTLVFKNKINQQLFMLDVPLELQVGDDE